MDSKEFIFLMGFMEKNPHMVMYKPDFENTMSFISGVIYLRDIVVYESFVAWLIKQKGAPANFAFGGMVKFLFAKGKLSEINDARDSENMIRYLFILWHEFLSSSN